MIKSPCLDPARCHLSDVQSSSHSLTPPCAAVTDPKVASASAPEVLPWALRQLGAEQGFQPRADTGSAHSGTRLLAALNVHTLHRSADGSCCPFLCPRPWAGGTEGCRPLVLLQSLTPAATAL